MAYIEVDIDVDNFLNECGYSEITYVIEWLQNHGHLEKEEATKASNRVSIPEQEFQDALDVLYDKWNMMNNEETDLIINISKRY